MHEPTIAAPAAFSTSETSVDDANVEKQGSAAHHVVTRERVPGHSNYYEKDGLRTYGDDFDHDHEPPVRHSGSLR